MQVLPVDSTDVLQNKYVYGTLAANVGMLMWGTVTAS
jgi:hypothetical protein